MSCKCKVGMVECGEPDTIPGVCYDHCVTCETCREEPADPITKVCATCKSSDTAVLPNGCTLYWKGNSVGGRIYTSDEIGCGVFVWDTSLISEDTLLAAIKKEHELDNITRIDIEKDFWQSIKKAAEESKWIPKDYYYMNDWVSDVCMYLREGHPQKEK